MGLLPIPGSGTSKSSEVIDTPSPGFTWLAGLSAAITTILAGLVVVGQGLGVDLVNAETPIKVALIALVGAGIIGWAIAATGDTIARAYALAHVVRTEPDERNLPAITVAATRLADAYAAANGLKLTTPATTTDSGTPAAATSLVYSPSSTAAPSSAAASKECCLEFSPPLQVKVRGKDAKAIAVLISGESGKETQRYLVGLPDSQLTWVNNDAISLPAATPAPVVTQPAPSGGTPPPGNGATTS